MQRPLRRFMRRSASAFLVSATTFSLIAPPASAAGVIPAFNPLSSATKIAAQQSVHTFTEDDIAKPRLGSLAFKSFDVTDPATKKPVDPNKTIIAPSGKSVRAGDYWARINALEQDLNTRGQSLRNGTTFELGTFKGGTQAELIATHSKAPQIKGHYDLTSGPDPLHQKLNPATLPQPDCNGAACSTSPVIGGPTITDIQATNNAAARSPYGYKSLGLKPIAPMPAPPAPPSVAKTVGYNDTWGSQNLAGISLNMSVTTEAGRGHVGHVLANEGVTAYLLGQSASILGATGDVNPRAATLDFSVLGDSVGNYSGPTTRFFNSVVNSNKSLSIFDFSVDIPVSIFTVTLGASAAFNFNAYGFAQGGSALEPSTAQLALDPVVNLLANFTAAFGVGESNGEYGLSLDVEADGALTIVQAAFPLDGYARDTLTMYRSGTLNTDKNIYGCSLTFRAFNKGQLNYQFLSGKVDVKLRGCVVFCFTVFTLHLFSWNGFTGQDTLFDQSTFKDGVPEGPSYSDLPDYGLNNLGQVYSKDDASGMPQGCDDLRRDQQRYGATN